MEQVLPTIRAGGTYHARGVGLRKDGTRFHLDVYETAFTTGIYVIVRVSQRAGRR